jgi:hypothetical protein
MENENKPIIGIKAFDKDLKCRDFQYEVGKTYKHDGKVELCKSGFHFCENPLAVFEFYPPTSRFAVAEATGEVERSESGDTKVACAEITIKAEIKLPEVVSRAVDWIISKIDRTLEQTNTGDQSAATNTGNRSAATNTGDQSVATNTGNRSVATNTGNLSASTNTGYQSVATNTGDQSVATNTGYQSVATNTGDQSVATNTGNQSVATNTGNRSVATNTGNRSVATNTGDQSAATNTGYQSAASVEGHHSVAIATGYQSKAKASFGSAIFLVCRDDDMKIIAVGAAIAGEKVKADTWYTLSVTGEFVECDA